MSDKRLHAFDGMRAAMMLLGLVLHTAASYTVTPLKEAWPYQDAHTSVVFDFVVFIIHLFRMPAFFVMAGFFAALLYQREGIGGFVGHRVRRLLLPLVVGWIVLFPIVIAAFAYTMSGGGTAGWPVVRALLSTSPYNPPDDRAWLSLMHLWFLYYLLIISLLAALIAWLTHRLPESIRTRGLAWFAAVASSGWSVLALAAVTAVTLLPMEVPGLETPLSMAPVPRIVVAYAVFFAFGWLIHARKDLIARFGDHPWRYLLAGAVASVIYMVIVLAPPAGDRTLWHIKGVSAAAVATWLLIYGITGVFVRHFHAPRPLQRYLSDAAYWMYLIHLPFAIVFAGVIEPLALPALIKFTIVVSATTMVTLISYSAFVRSTAIGKFLNGRKYARAIPAT